MQKSPVTSSVALSRLENETVMPKRENLKKNMKIEFPRPLEAGNRLGMLKKLE